MSEKNIRDLAEAEWEARQDHMSGDYSSEERKRWIKARDELKDEYWGSRGGDNDVD